MRSRAVSSILSVQQTDLRVVDRGNHTLQLVQRPYLHVHFPSPVQDILAGASLLPLWAATKHGSIEKGRIDRLDWSVGLLLAEGLALLGGACPLNGFDFGGNRTSCNNVGGFFGEKFLFTLLRGKQ